MAKSPRYQKPTKVTTSASDVKTTNKFREHILFEPDKNFTIQKGAGSLGSNLMYYLIFGCAFLALFLYPILGGHMSYQIGSYIRFDGLRGFINRLVRHFEFFDTHLTIPTIPKIPTAEVTATGGGIVYIVNVLKQLVNGLTGIVNGAILLVNSLARVIEFVVSLVWVFGEAVGYFVEVFKGNTIAWA